LIACPLHSLAGVQDNVTPSPRPAVFDSNPYVEVGASYEGLTNGYAPWQSQYLNLTMPMKEDGLVYLQLLNAQRFSEQDSSAYANYAYPLSLGTINIEGSYDPNAKFLAKNLGGIGWTGKLPESFNYLISTRATNYSDSRTNTNNYGLDKYIGQFRLAYTLVSSSLNSANNVWANKFQVKWYSESNNQIGLSYTSGHEPLLITPGNLTNVATKQMQIDGLYWFDKIGVTYSIWHAVEGAYYERNGGQLGLRIPF
jgi:YaiO family outer membrane protein